MGARASLIFTLSASSLSVGGGPIYITSKHAALDLMRALANDFAPDIRVNVIAPSGTPTELADAQILALPQAPGTPAPGQPGSKLLNVVVAADDRVGAYVLLAPDQSRAMTGKVINSDAGRGVTSGRP